MPKSGYVSVSVPKKIHSVLEEIVNDENSLYTSVSELIKEALREKIIVLRSQTIVPGSKFKK
ncbi:MAG: ribbon-helix-helix domain-containing protein [Promethearchaeota archaeon]|jgi:metal-responsive CopG/Arc/MetJ family transcriptional regulator